MNSIATRAALLSGGLAAALLIQPMGVTASDRFVNPSVPSTKTRQSDRQPAGWGVLKQTPFLLGIEASCLLIAACSSLALATSRENRRQRRDQQRIASSLSAAVRSGLLDEVERSDVPVWSIWGEEDDEDSAPRALVLSRYRVLGYSGEIRARAVDGEDLPIRTIVRADPLEIVTDEQLLLGIPRAVLKPEKQPFPWIESTSSASNEDTPQSGSNSEPYLLPSDLLGATGSLQ